MRRQVRIAARGLIGPIGCIVLLTHMATFILAAEPLPDIKGPAQTPTVLGATHCCGVIANPALKGRLGRLLVAFPAGAVPNGTKVAVLKDGKEVNAGYGNRTWDLLPGTYDVVISGKQVSNVTVQARHDTLVKVGVLRISIGPQTKVAVLDGGNEIAGGYGDRLIGLPLGSFDIHVAGQPQQVTINAGQVTDLEGQTCIGLGCQPERQQQQPVQVSLTPPTDGGVTGGNRVTATVTLSSNPGGGQLIDAIQLSSSHPAIAAVPAHVVIGAVQTSGTFSVDTLPVTAPVQVTISATHRGLTGTTSLTILPPVLSSVDLHGNVEGIPLVQTGPAPVWGGTFTDGWVKLTGPAPDGGLTVALSSSKPDQATVPPSVFIEPNQSSVGFRIKTLPVLARTIIHISATNSGVTKDASLTILPPRPSSVVCPPYVCGSVRGGQTRTGLILLNGRAPDGYHVTFGVSNPNLLKVLSILPIQQEPPGFFPGFSFIIEAIGSQAPTPVFLNSCAKFGCASNTLLVIPPTMALALSQTTVKGGQSVVGTVFYTDGQAHPSTLVNLSSTNKLVASPLGDSVPMGGAIVTRNFTITTSPVQEDTTVKIGARVPWSQKEVPLTVTK